MATAIQTRGNQSSVYADKNMDSAAGRAMA
jgi:hypothetical protein